MKLVKIQLRNKVISENVNTTVWTGSSSGGTTKNDGSKTDGSTQYQEK